MKITIDNIEYEVDLVKAKQQGLLKQVEVPIMSFKVGDVFKTPISSYRIVILSAGWAQYKVLMKYYMGGLNNVALNPFSNFSNGHSGGATEEEIIKELNRMKCTYVGNISDKLDQLVRELK
jgi:hypothetical protein